MSSTIIPSPPINTPADWWRLVDEYGNRIIDILDENTPYDSSRPLAAGMACDNAEDGWSIRRAFGVNRNTRNWKMCHQIIHRVWQALPDHHSIHGINGWSLLCDLCSETWVFDESEGGVG